MQTESISNNTSADFSNSPLVSIGQFYSGQVLDADYQKEAEFYNEIEKVVILSEN